MENNDRKDRISLFKFQLSYFRRCWYFLTGNMIATSLSSVVTLMIPLVIADFVGVRSKGVNILALVFLLLAFLSALRYYFSTMLGERMVLFMQRDFVARLVKFPPSFFNSRSTGEIFSTLVKDADRIKITIGIGFSSILRNFIIFIGSIVMMFIIDPNMALIVMVIIFILAVVLAFISKFSDEKFNSIQNYESKLLRIKYDIIRSVLMFQSFNAEKKALQRYNAEAEEVYGCVVKSILNRSYGIFLVIFIPSIGVSIALLFGTMRAHLVADMTVEDIAKFIFYALNSLGSIRSSSSFFWGILQTVDSIKRFHDFIECKIDVVSPSPLANPPSILLGSIAFRNVSFSFPGKSERHILKNIDFTITPGETVALVGLSGVGKTSLLSLILRFYDPCSGLIELDGVDILHIPLQEIRKTIALVPQNPIIINETVHDNIAIGCPTATREEVQRAAMIAQAHEFISGLDKEYDTVLGDNAVLLSVGQIQRIAIARAILVDPPILLLDELGSAIDIVSETKIWNLLRENRKDRTTIFVSHRLAAINETDTVIVLHDGIVLEKGRHNELINKSGFYSHLVGFGMSKTAS